MFFYNLVVDTVIDLIYYNEIKFQRFRKQLYGGELFANNTACYICIWVFKMARVANKKLRLKC